MTIENDLIARSEGKCELCASDKGLTVVDVPPASDGSADKSVLLCGVCRAQLVAPDTMDANHWRCLNDSMWTPVPAVQVMAWRALQHLQGEGWAQDLLGMLYLEDDVQAWAESATGEDDNGSAIRHLDSNGAELFAGDTVTLIKALVVKGANFTAKRGTAVRNISLVRDNAGQIEGRVNGQQIVILTEFVKRSG